MNATRMQQLHCTSVHKTLQSQRGHSALIKMHCFALPLIHDIYAREKTLTTSFRNAEVKCFLQAKQFTSCFISSCVSFLLTSIAFIPDAMP